MVTMERVSLADTLHQPLANVLEPSAASAAGCREHRQTPALLARAKPTFQKEIAATQSAGAAIFDMLAVLGLTTAVSKRRTNPLLAAETVCFEKEHRKTACTGRAGDLPFLPSPREAQPWGASLF